MSKPPLPWEKWELDALSEAWKNGGMKAAQAALPHRTSESIRGKAGYLNVKVEGRNEYTRQESSEWIDAALKRAYRSHRPNLKKLSKELDRTVAWLKLRAGILGVRHYYEGSRIWTSEEDKILTELIEDGNAISTIQKKIRKLGYFRSLPAIQTRVCLLKIGFNRDGWTATEVAGFFSIDIHSVLKWIDKGWLRASRKPGPSCVIPDQIDERRKWFSIADKDISKFMLEHPHAWDHRRMKVEVLIDLLCGRKVA